MNRDRLIGIINNEIDNPATYKRAKTELLAEYDRLTAELEHERAVKEELLARLGVLLDQVDYTAGACGPTEMVGAVLPRSVLFLAKSTIAAIRAAEEQTK